MERWDLYTENREPTGLTHLRGTPVPDGYFHLVCHVWIRNAKGEYLISRRAANRPTFPLYWECVGGSVLQGESALEGALREVREEVGLTLSACNGKLLFSRVRKRAGQRTFNDILDVWRFSFDGPVSLESASTDEVAQIRWMSIDEIRALYEAGQLVDTLSYFFTDVAPR